MEVYKSIENTYTYVKEVELEESMQAVFKQLISYEKQFDVCAAAWSVRTTTYEQTDTDVARTMMKPHADELVPASILLGRGHLAAKLTGEE